MILRKRSCPRIFTFRCLIFLGAALFVTVQILFVVLFMIAYNESILSQLSDASAMLPEEVLTTMEEYAREITDSHTSFQYVRKRKRQTGTDVIIQENQTIVQTFDVVDGCIVTNEEALSAINRATSPSCKNLIYQTACAIQQGHLYSTELPHSCPNDGHIYGQYLGCYQNVPKNRLLRGGMYNFGSVNSQNKCIDQCIELGFPYAGVQFGIECHCGDELPANQSRLSESSCNLKCPANVTENCGGLLTANIFETGIGKTVYLEKNYNVSHTNTTNPPIRIAFLLILNGRDVRQVIRLFKVLYHRDHYFFIHVDKRQEYMFRALVGLEKKFPNVHLARTRRSPIWGSASLVSTLLECMTEIVHKQWSFDFVINLSESDFPLQTTEKLEAFLWSNRDRNFAGCPNPEPQNVEMQGAKKTFVECDDRMWLVGDRKYPKGIVFQAGSDWFIFSHALVHYLVTAENDTLLDGLKLLHKYTIMAAESFFHTFLRNSKFCVTRVNENLRRINWQRHYGCQCQQKPVVDWCGCSPNDFVAADWPHLEAVMKNGEVFFGRKFDATISQTIINKIEEKLYHRNWGENGRRYWHNIYHYVETMHDETLITLCSSLSRRALQTFANDNSSTSDFIFSKVLQVFSYHEDDLLKGILVHFEATDSKNIPIQIEAWFINQYSFTLYNINVSSRFIHLQVGTDFDVKERIFRNRLGVVGPFSQPVLMYEVARGSVINNISVLWLDPTQKMVDINIINSVSSFSNVHHLESSLSIPLIYGKWEVFLVHNSLVLARVPFLVVPSSKNYAKMWKLPKTYESPNIKFMRPVVELLKRDYNPMLKTAEMLKNESYTGAERLKFIDDLMKSIYKLMKLCFLPLRNENAQSEYYKPDVSYCSASYWSSFFSDPKGHISAINKITGRLNF